MVIFFKDLILTNTIYERRQKTNKKKTHPIMHLQSYGKVVDYCLLGSINPLYILLSGETPPLTLVARHTCFLNDRP